MSVTPSGMLMLLREKQPSNLLSIIEDVPEAKFAFSNVYIFTLHDAGTVISVTPVPSKEQ